MRIYVQELSGEALDWAVERALGTPWNEQKQEFLITRGVFAYSDILGEWPYSTDAIAALPIIEKNLISVGPVLNRDGTLGQWLAGKTSGVVATGPTFLVAAMRCYVKTCFGPEEIDVPDEVVRRSKT